MLTARREVAVSNHTEFPPGWDEGRVARVIRRYENQSDESAVAEDEAALEAPGETLMEVPVELASAIRPLIAEHKRNA